ncbi:hypothetical protein OJF2_23830 [Aquisphaera giovannonii]|uniref:PH domain-containing protein n=1 Tax=Aquisphaera giovannonii TaxID=406548 RepID=A0A5B9VZR1_9BACT|nr:hypothetical protein [Aquisphaera giovannonii]QEH33852.1 hypothetical protein OJF2_23830 [Aquisphaera giovannonii]
MKVYRVTPAYLWLTRLTKLGLTLGAGALYLNAVTHPTPLAARLLLLAGLAAFIWVFYVRLPRRPTEIELGEDGWIEFRGKKAARQVHVASIRSIRRGPTPRSVRIRHGGGSVRFPARFRHFYDFLASVKAMNPAIDIRGF